MPAVTTHYQFGQLVFWRFSGDIAEEIATHKRMFDIGLQGPDPLFYAKTNSSNRYYALATQIHEQSGRLFFERALAQVPHCCGEQAMALVAYLMGCACHYALDKLCHPFVDRIAPEKTEHQILESKVDRLITDKYALSDRRQMYTPVALLDYEAIACTFDGLGKDEAKLMCKNFRFYTALLNHPRTVAMAEQVLGITGSFLPLCMPNSVEMSDELSEFMQLFDDAIAEGQTLAEEIWSAYRLGTNLSEHFDLNFNGRAVL